MNNDERKFLHDLSSPFAMVFYHLDSMIEDLNEKPNPDQKLIQQLQNIFHTLEKMKSQLDQRRQILLEREEGSTL